MTFLKVRREKEETTKIW